MNNSFCDQYLGFGTVWPVSAFPGNLFPSYTAGRRRDAQNAWNFFELVESTDAATRVFWSNRGGWTPPATSAFAQPPSLWYPIQNQGFLTLYKQGKLLHEQACPSVVWTAQRNLGIPTTPLTDVYPAQCPS
jgi:hypothetical protein